MKKIAAKRFLSAFLALIMVFGMLPILGIGVSAAIPVSEGLTFKDDDRYTTNSTPAKEPLTFEAEFTLGMSSGWMGTIIGNWDTARTGASLDLGWNSTNGAFPRLIYNKSRVEFKEIDMRNYASNGQYARLIVTIEKGVLEGDKPNNITCYVYVNGELKQQQSISNSGINITPKKPYTVGYGCFKYDAPIPYISFSGHIKNIAVYSDVRTETERAADGKKFNASSKDGNLLLAYNFTTRTPLKDISKNGNDLTNLGDYKYTFAQGAITDRYRMDKELKSAPHTFAAEIKVSERKYGTIFSDYKDNKTKYMSFAVNKSGAPVLEFSTASGTVAKVVFDKVNLFTETFNKVVVTHTDTEAKCYVNGELKQTVSGDFVYHKDVITVPDDNFDTSDDARYIDPNEQYFVLGGDCSEANSNYFQGTMKSFSMYSEALSAEDVAALTSNGINADIDSVISYYDLSDYWEGYIADISGNQYHVSHELYEMREDKRGDYAYSFAVIGDTQRQSYFDYRETTGTLDPTDQTYTDDEIVMKHSARYYDWVVANKEKKKIQYVFGMGDITNYDYDLEWYIQKSQITKLDAAGIPYSLIVGNHDTVAKLTENFADPSDDFYTKRVSGYFEDGVLGNYYMNFEVGSTKYMVMNFEFGPSDAVLEWANQVVAANPDRRVIVTTHAYTDSNGERLNDNSYAPPRNGNDGEEMWEKFVSLHGNIVLVLSGHKSSYQVVSRQDKGVNGNTVTQMLIDQQSENVNRAQICMLYFNEDGSEVFAEWIAAGETLIAQETYPEIPDILFRANSQFSLTLIDDEPSNIYSVTGDSDNYTAYYTDGTSKDFTAANVLADVSGYKLTLKGDIGLKSYFNIPAFASYDKLYVKFTVDGAETEIPFSNAENTEYGYGFECLVNATQMTSKVKIELYYEDILLADNEYSVAEYAKTIMTDDAYADARGVVKAMLNYGSLSQEYFEIEAEDPAKDYKYTDELAAVTRDVIAEKSVNKKTGSVEGLAYAGSWVELRSTLVLYHAFTVNGDIADYTFTFGDETLEPIYMGGNTYAVAVTEIYAQDMATEYAITVNGTYTLTYNALNYLKLAYGDASLTELVSALYLYYAEAYDYFN